MKTRIPKMFGVALTLALVVSLFGFAVPVSAQPGNTQWLAQPLPTAAGNVMFNGSDITDIAVAADGNTIYVLNAAVNLNAANAVFISTNAGQTFTACAIPAGAAGNPGRAIAVAPDNPLVVAVVETVANVVHVSNDGGITWSTLPALAGTVAGSTMTDVAVCPARPGTLMGREFVVTTADPTAGVTGADTVQAVVVSAPWSAALGTYNITYTNQAGTAGRVSGNFTIPANSPAATVVAIPLAAGDTGVRAVTAMTVVVASGGGALDNFNVIGATSAVNFGNCTDAGVFTPGAVIATGAGDVQIIGNIATWASAGATTGILGTNDYMAVAVTPNFVGDRCVVVVGSSATFPKLQIINTATTTVVVTTVMGTTTIDFNAAAANSILTADVSLPSNFDPSTIPGQRSYACFSSVAPNTDNDVFRVDATSRFALGVATLQGIHTCSYSGTIDDGTLFVGYRVGSTVRYAENPQVALPTWRTSLNAPSGPAAPGVALTVVRAAADFPATNRVFGGTTGAQSALCVSDNAGSSFAGESLVDNTAANTVVAIDSIAAAPNDEYLFVATRNTALGVAGNLSLWRTTTPINAASWSRVFTVAKNVAATSIGLVRCNPDWTGEATKAVYFVDNSLAGPIYYSADGGNIFAVRNGPTAVTITAGCLAVEDANTAYVAVGTNVYKTVTGAWTWQLPVLAEPGGVVSLAVPTAGTLLVGGTGALSYSTDGGATFTRVVSVAGDTYLICGDENFADNNTAYLADTSGTTNALYRFIIGTDTAPIALTNPTAAVSIGVAHLNGALYGMSAAACDRNLFSYLEPGVVALLWDTMNAPVGTPAAAARFAIASDTGNVLYAATAAAVLWAYDDWLANYQLNIQSPPDMYEVPIDPVTGRAEAVWATWDPAGSGTGLVNAVQIRIWETAMGPGGATNLGAVAPFTAILGIAPRVDFAALMAAAGVPLRANTEYQWQIIPRNTAAADAVRGMWSEVRTFTIQAGTAVVPEEAGPILQAPPPGSSSVGVNPGFSWVAEPGTTEWKFWLALDASLTNTVEGTPVIVTTPSWQVPPGTLEYNTTYFWGVQSTKPAVGILKVASFTTMSEPLPPEPPPDVIVNIPEAETPAYVWAIIGVGAILVIVVLVLIVRTRRPL